METFFEERVVEIEAIEDGSIDKITTRTPHGLGAGQRVRVETFLHKPVRSLVTATVVDSSIFQTPGQFAGGVSFSSGEVGVSSRLVGTITGRFYEVPRSPIAVAGNITIGNGERVAVLTSCEPPAPFPPDSILSIPSAGITDAPILSVVTEKVCGCGHETSYQTKIAVGTPATSAITETTNFSVSGKILDLALDAPLGAEIIPSTNITISGDPDYGQVEIAISVGAMNGLIVGQVYQLRVFAGSRLILIVPLFVQA